MFGLEQKGEERLHELEKVMREEIFAIEEFLLKNKVSVGGNNIKRAISQNAAPVPAIEDIASKIRDHRGKMDKLHHIREEKERISNHYLRQLRFHKFEPECCINGSCEGQEHYRIVNGLADTVSIYNLWSAFLERRQHDIVCTLSENEIDIYGINGKQLNSLNRILLDLMSLDEDLIVASPGNPSRGLFSTLGSPIQLYHEIYIENLYKDCVTRTLEHLAQTKGATLSSREYEQNRTSEQFDSVRTSDLLEFWRHLLEIECAARVFWDTVCQRYCKFWDARHNYTVQSWYGKQLHCVSNDYDAETTKTLAFLFKSALRAGLGSMSSYEDSIIRQKGPQLFVPCWDPTEGSNSRQDVVLCGTRKLIDALMAAANIVSDDGILGLPFLYEFAVIVREEVQTYLEALVDRVTKVMKATSYMKEDKKEKPSLHKNGSSTKKQSQKVSPKFKILSDSRLRSPIFGQLPTSSKVVEDELGNAEDVDYNKVEFDNYTSRMCYASLASADCLMSCCDAILDTVELRRHSESCTTEVKSGLMVLRELRDTVAGLTAHLECHITHVQVKHASMYVLDNASYKFESPPISGELSSVGAALFSHPLVMHQYYLDGILHDVMQQMRCTPTSEESHPMFEEELSDYSSIPNKSARKTPSSDEVWKNHSLHRVYLNIALETLKVVVDNFTNEYRPVIQDPKQFVLDVTFVLAMTFWNTTRAEQMGSTNGLADGGGSPMKYFETISTLETAHGNTTGYQPHNGSFSRNLVEEQSSKEQTCCNPLCSNRTVEVRNATISLCAHLIPLVVVLTCSKHELERLVKTMTSAARPVHHHSMKGNPFKVPASCGTAILGLKKVWQVFDHLLFTAKANLQEYSDDAETVEKLKTSFQQNGSGILTGFKPMVYFGGNFDMFVEPSQIAHLAYPTDAWKDLPRIHWDDLAQSIDYREVLATSGAVHLKRVLSVRLASLDDNSSDATLCALIQTFLDS